MDLNLPKEAVVHFNKKSDEFLFLLKPEPTREKRDKIKSSRTEQFSYELSENDIISIGTAMEIDGFGFCGIYSSSVSKIKVNGVSLRIPPVVAEAATIVMV